MDNQDIKKQAQGQVDAAYESIRVAKEAKAATDQKITLTSYDLKNARVVQDTERTKLENYSAQRDKYQDLSNQYAEKAKNAPPGSLEREQHQTVADLHYDTAQAASRKADKAQSKLDEYTNKEQELLSERKQLIKEYDDQTREIANHATTLRTAEAKVKEVDNTPAGATAQAYGDTNGTSTATSPNSNDQSAIKSNSDASIAGNMDSKDTFARAKEMAKPQNENGQPLTETVTPGTGSRPVANVNLSETAVSVPKVEVSGVNKQPDDWRVRLSLAPGADYLYRSSDISYNDVLFPLKDTDGVIFPYLPQINMSYRANYAPVEITHTNYKNYFYTNSSLDDITIIAEFTAQDNVEAKYMLAVIHFFKSVTKMFYGQDINPRGGTPPPLCYLSGFGSYQFKNHPLVLSMFQYNLPNDVDYIRTETFDAFTAGGIPVRKQNAQQKKSNPFNDFLSKHRLSGSNLNKNAVPSGPNFKSLTSSDSQVTYVPSKIQIQLTAHPIVTRLDISENFKLNGKNSYSSGDLVKTRGMW